MNCAFCSQMIDDDSYFCDQCGQQILLCPTCGALGTKKRCTNDGTPLVTAQERAQGASPGGAAPQGPPTAAPAQPTGATPTNWGTATGQAPAPSPTSWGTSTGSGAGPVSSGTPMGAGSPQPGAAQAAPGASAAAGGPELTLVNANLGLNLAISPQTIIGRKTGEYAAVFAQHSSVSSKHVQFTRDPAGQWFAIDLGSTNGTFLGDRQLPPNQPAPLSDGGFITIANIEFFVQIAGAAPSDDAEGGTMRL